MEASPRAKEAESAVKFKEAQIAAEPGEGMNKNALAAGKLRIGALNWLRGLAWCVGGTATLFVLMLFVSGSVPAQDAPIAPQDCLPPCSPGYLCLEGVCIEACNPRCQPSERCTGERICVDRQIQRPQSTTTQAAGQPSPAKPPAKGTFCAFRSKKLYAAALEFQVAIDDFRIAVLGRGEYACSTVTAGIHRVTLSTPVAGYTHTAPSVSVQIDVAEGEAAYLEASIGGGMLAPVMYLTPLSVSQAEGFMKSLALAASERRQ